jgi:hypothetical protein
MSITAGYDPSQWQNAMGQMINAPPQISAPQFSAPMSGGYSPGNFNTTLPNINGGTGGTYNSGTGNITGYSPATQNLSFGQKYNNFMGTYGQSIGQGISAAGALFNLYGGIKSLGLMQKQFKLSKKTTRLGVDNAAIAGNNQIAHHEDAVNNGRAARGQGAKASIYTPFKGWDA